MTPPSSPESCDEDDASRRGGLEFESYRLGLRSFLRSRLNDDSDVDDCLQSLWLKWSEHRSKIPNAAVRAWLFTVAANEARQLWRKRKRHRRVAEAWGDAFDNEVLADDPIVRRETQDMVCRAVERLPEELRQVVQLRLESDATFEQIAERLQIPLGTALSRMHRALARLQQQLRPFRD